MKKKECSICVYSLLFMCKGCGLCDDIEDNSVKIPKVKKNEKILSFLL